MDAAVDVAVVETMNAMLAPLQRTNAKCDSKTNPIPMLPLGMTEVGEMDVALAVEPTEPGQGAADCLGHWQY
jgi:hypothetical protein